MSIYAILVGTAGNQVLEWPELDSEIKTAELKNVSGNASFAAFRLLIAQHRISLRSCTSTVLVVENSADRPCIASSMRRCILIGGPVSRSVGFQFRDLSTRMVSQPIAGSISRPRSILNTIHHSVCACNSLLVNRVHADTTLLSPPQLHEPDVQ